MNKLKTKTAMIDVLIIDDDEHICKFLSKIFKKKGYSVCYHLSLAQGLKYIFSDDSDHVSVIFLDVHLPDGDGLGAIKKIRQHPFSPEIIIITGEKDADGAELAIRSKAWDYITKSESTHKFKFALDRAIEYRRHKRLSYHQAKIDREAIIGASSLISNCLNKVSQAAKGDMPVLITGETGTGKEIFARAIHDNSLYAHAKFIAVDCAALPEHLVESTLFGHVEGAFTGARSNRTGLIQMANKGTLFLDEVGELPIEVQKKFLRVLQDKSFRPVGSKNVVHSDFRLVCATHRDLEGMVFKKNFREDLFFRMVSMQLILPPLKDRGNDVELIAHHCLRRQNESFSKNACTMSPEFVQEIQHYEWPGNVRELSNVIELACSDVHPDGILYPHHLPAHIRAFNVRKKVSASSKNEVISSQPFSKVLKGPGDFLKFKDHVEKTKLTYIEDLLSATNGNIKEFCKVSGLSRGHLYRLFKQYHIKPR